MSLPGFRQNFLWPHLSLRILHPHLRADISQQRNSLLQDVAKARNVHGQRRGSENICAGLAHQGVS